MQNKRVKSSRQRRRWVTPLIVKKVSVNKCQGAGCTVGALCGEEGGVVETS